jgi:Arc/MetJ-type ribon-helix-helix transcriptional regulator
VSINLTPEQERIVNDELKSGQFRSAEEVIAKALVALREKERSSSLTTTAITMTPCAKCSTLSRKTALLCSASLLSN